MMQDQLTSQEIDHLYKFVESKNVPWPDVQAEIVDHLATDIEEQMRNNEHLSFRRALDRVYGKFPITGFVHLVEERKTAVKRYWRRRLIPVLLNYLKPPHIFFIIGFSVLLYYTMNLLDTSGSLFVLIPFAFLAILEKLVIKHNKKTKEQNPYRSLLFADILNNYRLGANMIYLFFPFINIFDNFGKEVGEISPTSPLLLGIMSIYISLIFVYIHAQQYRFPELIKSEFDNRYTHLSDRLHKIATSS